MNLPLFKSISKPSTVNGGFGGIAENSLADSVNLSYSLGCRTRNPRKAVMALNEPPNQVITCENRLFLRYGNILKEVEMDDGVLKESDQKYELSNFEPSPDRRLIGWDGKVFVFPDKIQIGLDEWFLFAENLSTSAALPFVDPRTLFYSENAESEAYCDDAFSLRVGMKLRFSWVTEKDFVVKTVEDYMSPTDDESTSVREGIRITLDSDVPNFSTPPANGFIEFCDPQTRPLSNDLTVGFNHRVTFSGNRIIIKSVEAPYEIPLAEFFKVGQTVEISGSSVIKNNGNAKITDIIEDCLYLNRTFTAVKEDEQTEITITPVIPDFSHFLITEDRLFGADNEKGKFYISALKNPFLFYDDGTKSEDAWSVNMNEAATGITLWKDNIICFTESGGFRILGYHANNFGVRHLSVNGIKKGCEASLCRIGDTLYYCSKRGIMCYSGGSDKRVFDSAFQVTNVKSAITDGVFVYMFDGERIWVYDTNTKQCWSEDGENISQIFTFNAERYLLLGDTLFLAEAESGEDVSWSFELHNLPDNKFQKVLPISFTVNHSESTDCTFNLYYRSFGEPIWKSCGVYTIKGEGATEIPLPKGYCNGFRLRVEGNGSFASEDWRVVYRSPK